MTTRRTMVEDFAIELRWMDHRDHVYTEGRFAHAGLNRVQVWDRCSKNLKDWYRADARRLLAVIEPHRRATSARVHFANGWQACRDALDDGPRIAKWIGLADGPASLQGAVAYLLPAAVYLDAIRDQALEEAT